MKKFVSLLTASILLSSLDTGALTPGAALMIDMETRANAVATRSNKSVMMPHFEIPLNMLSLDFADRFSAEIQNHLVFERDGQKYVRWILNPEDTKWAAELKANFAERGVTLKEKYYFNGYQTASRSYIVEDPKGEVQFSVKSSTNKTGGNWSDKKQPVGEAIDSRLNADFLADIQRRLSFEHFAIMDEPAIMKITEVDQAVVIRDLHELNDPKSGKIYVPGFSVLHEEVGRTIAKKNGSADPYTFWTEHYVKATARALAEFGARTGMQFDSPHSQNFLVEMDKNYKPTGRIILRDLADLYIDRTIVTALHSNPEEYFKTFTQKGNVLNHIEGNFGPLHGNKFPSWISEKQYTEWMPIYYQEYEKTFSRISGLDISLFKYGNKSQSGHYFLNTYDINSQAETFWHNMKKYKTPTGVMNCSFIMSM